MNRPAPDHPTVHYENDPEFFAAFLDPYLKYGSGYFVAEDEPFAPAVVRMLDRAIDAGRLRRDDAVVLDVGSGWGSMTRRLRERFPAIRYHHVNPTARQRQYIEERFGPAERTFPSLAEEASFPAATYDAIFFSDSLCHVRDRVAVLERARRALIDGGRIVVQNNYFLSAELWERHRAAPATRYVQDEIFGFAEITDLERFVQEAAAAGLRLVELEDISRHYLRTVLAWLERLQTLDAARFPLRDPCIRYLKLSAAGFDYSICEHFMVLAPLASSRRELRNNLSQLRRP
jgi:cyclopropane-fatty-acyl-phospholipid synthase